MVGKVYPGAQTFDKNTTKRHLFHASKCDALRAMDNAKFVRVNKLMVGLRLADSGDQSMHDEKRSCEYCEAKLGLSPFPVCSLLSVLDGGTL